MAVNAYSVTRARGAVKALNYRVLKDAKSARFDKNNYLPLLKELEEFVNGAAEEKGIK